MPESSTEEVTLHSQSPNNSWLFWLTVTAALSLGYFSLRTSAEAFFFLSGAYDYSRSPPDVLDVLLRYGPIITTAIVMLIGLVGSLRLANRPVYFLLLLSSLAICFFTIAWAPLVTRGGAGMFQVLGPLFMLAPTAGLFALGVIIATIEKTNHRRFLLFLTVLLTAWLSWAVFLVKMQHLHFVQSELRDVVAAQAALAWFPYIFAPLFLFGAMLLYRRRNLPGIANTSHEPIGTFFIRAARDKRIWTVLVSVALARFVLSLSPQVVFGDAYAPAFVGYTVLALSTVAVFYFRIPTKPLDPQHIVFWGSAVLLVAFAIGVAAQSTGLRILTDLSTLVTRTAAIVVIAAATAYLLATFDSTDAPKRVPDYAKALLLIFAAQSSILWVVLFFMESLGSGSMVTPTGVHVIGVTAATFLVWSVSLLPKTFEAAEISSQR